MYEHYENYDRYIPDVMLKKHRNLALRGFFLSMGQNLQKISRNIG